MISGKTTVVAHLGYPTFAFKAPMIYNPWFDKKGIDAVVVPMGVKPEEYRAIFPLLFKMSNIRGALVTMPHKVVTCELVDELTPTATIAGAANAVLVREDGSLLGDQFDGAGFVRGVQRKGFALAGARALVVGNGGVGSPIAASLAATGLSGMGLFDPNQAASDGLAERLHAHYPDMQIETGSKDPDGYDLVVNATPLGMNDGDPLPMDVERIAPSTFVGEVVMKQTITPFLAAAQARGCPIQVGSDMLFEQIPAYLEFFGFGVATPEELRDSRTAADMTDRHKVVIVGGGFGGLNAVRALAHADVDVTVVDRTNHHLFQPLLYQVAAGILPPGLIAPALRGVIKKQANARAVLAEVTDIDLEGRVVAATGPDGRPLALPYDTLVVAAGATHSYFGRDDFARYAPGMKTVENARHLRDAILLAFEMAEIATDPVERAEWLTFVVIGAGPTGVELVGQVAELAHKVLPRDYRTVNTKEAQILLLEGAGAVLGPFPEKLREYTRNKLESMGVDVRLNTLAVDMDDESITVKGPDGLEVIRTRTRIWAAGVQASPLAKLLAQKAGLEVDRAGRIPVQPDCSLAGHPEVFARRRHGGAEQPAGGGAARHAGGQVRREADRRQALRATRRPSRSSTSTKATWPRSGTGPPSPTRSA